MEKKTRRSTPRRLYYGPEKMRAAFMAGAGRSGTKIATALGGTSSHKVRAMLRKAGIEMPETSRHRAFPLMLLQREADMLTVQADRRDVTPAALPAALISTCVIEPALLDNILDDDAGSG